MIETISGAIVGVLIIFISQALSKHFTSKLVAVTILVAIAFIYVGFSLKDNPVELIILEVLVALILYFMAIVGYKRNNSLIAIGIILHGIWDIIHHNAFLINTDVPAYWPSFCMTIDIIDGIYFLVIFQKQKRTKQALA